jgi:hypothetical protein
MLEPYQKAPDAEVIFSDRAVHRLSNLWIKEPMFLVFLRHFG